MISQVKQRQVGQNTLFVVERKAHPTDTSPTITRTYIVWPLPVTVWIAHDSWPFLAVVRKFKYLFKQKYLDKLKYLFKQRYLFTCLSWSTVEAKVPV